MAGALTMVINVLLLLLVFMEVVPGAAQEAPGPSPPPIPELITCSLPNTSTISPNYCNAYDEGSMDTQTQSCGPFLTGSEAAPSKDCCSGLNSVNRTACICKLTFYPPAQHDAARQMELPRLCGVLTDLCGQCPTFLVSRSNGTAPTTPIADAPFSDGKSTASKVGAITLAVVFGLLVVFGIAALNIMVIKNRKAKNSPPEVFEPTPPGGAF